jgi:hypothetical protein
MQYSNFFITYGGIWKIYLNSGWARNVKVIVKGYYLVLYKVCMIKLSTLQLSASNMSLTLCIP